MNIPRMWLGYARSDVTLERFHQQLGQIFMPTTVQVMGQLGLQSYIPTVLPSVEGLANEVALVFYPSPKDYQDACSQSCAGRMYSALHQTLFAFPESHSDFPIDNIEIKPYSQANYIKLFDIMQNWQQGQILTEVWQGTELTTEQFKEQVMLFIQYTKQFDQTKLKGVYFYVKAPFLISWSCWQEQPYSLVASLSKGIVITSQTAIAVKTPSLFESYQGVKVNHNTSFNFQFITC